MSDTTTLPAPRIWTADGFRDDDWVHADSAEALDRNAIDSQEIERDAGGKPLHTFPHPALAGNRRIILPLEAFLALDPSVREGAGDRIGVLLAPGEALDTLVPHLDTLPLVALAFPAFSDGRSYSKAVLLRTRYGYRGTVRAAGDVLIDQIPLMLRTGFDALEVTNEVAIARLAEGRVGGIAFRYQPSAAEEAPGARYSWRRVPAA